MSSQLPLNLSPPWGQNFENFYVAENQVAYYHLLRLGVENSEQFIYLYGNPGVGKTHLLHSVCHRQSELSPPVAYICLRENKHLGPEILDGMNNMSLLCLDNIDAVSGDKLWELALFNLYNSLREAHIPLLVSACFAPSSSEFELADLVSRLNWGLTLKLLELSDQDKVKAIQLRAKEIGLHLPGEVGHYLLKRCPRDMHALLDFLDRLDYESLASQRKLTIPFVRALLD